MFGKIIISEVFLPEKYRTIKPLKNVGGKAGGEKFLYNGILFKFAVDWADIYGSDEAAMKVKRVSPDPLRINEISTQNSC
jgi:hypothetical protein